MNISTKQKINEAIQECDRYIDKEGSRNDDLRPTDVQKLLDWYKEHRAKLVKMLEGG